MRREILFVSLLMMAALLKAQPKTARIEPLEPIRYENKDGRWVVLSYIKQPGMDSGGSVGEINGKTTELISTDRPDSLLVWLPLVGEETTVKVISPRRVWVDQTVRPLIPSDWGYFAGGTIHLIQSSHQDVAWMDTPDYCRKDRIEEIILPALQLTEKNKDFKFEMEQTLNLMEFLDAYPDRKAQLVALYKEKRFGWGATYNQPYEGLSSGEQLVRQAYYGRKWIVENLPGCDDRVANNMDVPGRTWQMPQILAKSGIPYLFVSRMREGLFNWYSPDGSKVLTFSPGNYGWASMMWKFFDRDGVTALRKLHHRSLLWSDYFRRHAIPPHYAVLMSCDATKPVDYQPVIDEWNRIASQSEAPLPRLVCSTAESYFEAVRADTNRLERIEGERPDLWLYIHGPAHYRATTYKRQAARLLPAAETFHSMAGVLENKLDAYPRADFDRAWRASIYPDHGLGGKNGEITDAIFEDSLKLARDLGRQLLWEALGRLTQKVDAPQGSWVVFNALAWCRDQWVEIDISADRAVVEDADGRRVPAQIRTCEGKKSIVFLAEKVPSLGYRVYRVKEGKSGGANQAGVSVSANRFENAYYRALLGKGGIVSLYDKELGKELVHTSKFAFGDVAELGYTGHGAGEFTRITDPTPGDLTPLSQFETCWKVAESGPVYTRFENVQPTRHATIVQSITFRHACKQIDFDITLRDFDGAHNRQYRILLPLNMTAERTVSYEVPMGVATVGRDEWSEKPGGWAWEGTYVDNPADTHPREIQNFISASGNGFGVTMASGVAVADWVDPSRDQAIYPVLQGILLSSHKSCHAEGNWFHQTGTHTFHFSLTSHPEGWTNGYAFGIGRNHPLAAVRKTNKGGELAASHSFLSISDPLVALSLVKKADRDNHLIIRLTEMEGKDKEVKVTLPVSVKKVIRTNLVEEEGEEWPVGGKVVSFKLGHHAIETFKLVL